MRFFWIGVKGRADLQMSCCYRQVKCQKLTLQKMESILLFLCGSFSKLGFLLPSIFSANTEPYLPEGETRQIPSGDSSWLPLLFTVMPY